MRVPARAEALLARFEIDLENLRTPPQLGRVALATVVAIVVSLAADAALVAIGIRLFPTTRHFAHFRFSDYATLTVLGVLAAGAGWPLAVRVSGAARRLYRQAAVAVTLVLLLPDVYILLKGEPTRAVAVLMVMHLAIALCTYHLVVRLAPVPSGAGAGALSSADSTATATAPVAGITSAGAAAIADAPGGTLDPRRWWFVAMGSASTFELLVGLLALVAVPYGRPSEVLVHGRGSAIYLLHGVLGLALGFGAVALVLACRRASRRWRGAAIAGLIGLVLGGIGGALVVDRPARLAGVGLMLVGAVFGASAYFLPMLSEQDPGSDARGAGETAGASSVL